MGLSRRQFTNEFKLAAVRRLEQEVSIAEAARALKVSPDAPAHRVDELPAGYSLAGWFPPEPASASPAGSSMRYSHLAGRGDFSERPTVS